MLTIGTDCSGIEAPIEALKQLGILFVHKWSCEIDKFARQSILANYHPEILYKDITMRDHSALPDVDLYVAGFPCQSFSLMGKRLGTNDPRSNIMNHCIQVIKVKRPGVFILENVKNFKHIQNGKPFNTLITELSGMKDDDNESCYSIYADIYNTKDYGIPQNRERVYIIGISKDIQISDFKKPENLQMKPLEDMLLDKMVYNTTPNKTISQKINDKEPYFICPCNNYTKGMYNICPTLTTTCNTFYHNHYNRYLTPIECLSLQGFPTDFVQVVSKTQICKQIGNSMSVNVLKAIIKQILKCTLLGEFVFPQ